jgi:8-oxo-dGTP diphosphatase
VEGLQKTLRMGWLFRMFCTMQDVAVGILARNGTVLAGQRRRNARYPLKWEFPGGKVETGETPTQALARELREELSLETSPTEEFFIQTWDYGNHTYRVFYYILRSFRGEPINNSFEQIAWVTPHELLTMDILEGNRTAIEKLAGAMVGRAP